MEEPIHDTGEIDMALKNLILDKVVVSGNKVEYPFRAADALKKYFTKDKITIEIGRAHV